MSQENLVLNYSFEEYDSLPSQVDQPISYVRHWYLPSTGTVDYFNANCNSDYLSKMEADVNYTSSYYGNACIGLILFAWDGYMEHITGELKQSLEADSLYELSFWIKYSGAVSQFSTDCIGILLTENKFFFTPPTPFYESIIKNSLYANIETENNEFFRNDTTWRKISFLYKAKGGEKYITIGKFFNDEININSINKYRNAEVQCNASKKNKFVNNKKQQKVLLINPDFMVNNNVIYEAYYFIDNVKVSKINTEKSCSSLNNRN